MIFAGPCLLNDDEHEIENFYKTAEELAKIDNTIVYRCKVIGGGTRPDRWAPGIRSFEFFSGIDMLDTATEIHTIEQARDAISDGVDWLWVGARNAQNYTLLQDLAKFSEEESVPLLIKRHPGMGIEETIGLYDLYMENGAHEVYLCERGINTFNRTEEIRWQPDFQFMAHVLNERPDIELVFDLSHSSFHRGLLFQYARAAAAMGVENFMVECYHDTDATRSDKAHALCMRDFRRLYKIIS